MKIDRLKMRAAGLGWQNHSFIRVSTAAVLLF